MPRVAPEPAAKHFAAVLWPGLEALELIVAHDLEAEPDREQQYSQTIDQGKPDGVRGANRDEERERDEPQERALQPEDREQAPPPEGGPMGGAHRLIATVFAFAMVPEKEVDGEARLPTASSVS